MTKSKPDMRGLVAWFASNSVAANLLMAALLVGGVLMMSRTNAEILPQIDPRAISINVGYPGATPEEVEDSITRRIEDAVVGLEGVERVSSSAVEGRGRVTIELNDVIDAETVRDSAQSAVDRLIAFPPEDADEPEIMIVKSVSPVMRLIVAGDVGERAVKRAGQELERELLAIDGISIVTLQGARADEISIEVSEDALRAYGLNLDQVANAVRASSLNLSAGAVRAESGDILLRMENEARSGDSFSDIVVLSDQSGQRITLGDIADIRDGFSQDPLVNTYNGRPAVFLQIDRAADEDAFKVQHAVTEFLETYKPSSGIEVIVTADRTETIRDRINLLARNGVLGLCLVFLFLALTLDLRLAVWTCVGIPVAFLGGLTLFGNLTTINMTSLLGLIMVLGIVVDDAIVVGENIYDHQIRHGSGVATAVAGTKSVLAPVIIGVMTSMISFATLLQSPGMMGQLLQPVPIVVLSVLFISLIEVFLILPSHLAHGGEWSVGAMARLKGAVHGFIESVRDRFVIPAVGWTVRYPYAVVAACAAILIAATGLQTGGHLRFVFFPTVESDEITVSLEMPAGVPFEQTEAAMERVVDAALVSVDGPDSDLFKSLSVTVGGRLASGFGTEGTVTQANIAMATLELAPAGERDLSATELERRWRDAVGDIPGLKSLTFESSSLSGGADISFNLSHADSSALADNVQALTDRLAEIDGVTEIDTTAEPGKRQIEFTLTPAGSAAGLTVADLARHLRSAYFGEEVQRFQRNGEEVEVYVRFPESERRSLADLARLRIPLASGGTIALSAAAEFEETRSFVSIDRVDGQRIVTVTADVDEAVTTPSRVNAFITSEIIPVLETGDRGLRIVADGQTRDQAEELRSLFRNFAIAVLLIYVLLASVLRSYVQPLLILAIIPFGLVGAVLGHMAMGYDMTFLSLFGVVALAGVIINDSVVLLDYFNKLEREGGDRLANIVEAVRRRFRAILLTTLTTVLGLLPMIAETSMQAQFLIPMALSLGFGILFASIVILLLVPALLALGAKTTAIDGATGSNAQVSLPG